MYRGTTPTLEIKITGIEVTQLESVYVTLSQYKRQVTKETQDITIDELNNTLYVPLLQEDTLSLKRGYAYIQIRAVTKDGLAVASEIKMVPVVEILRGDVIV